MAEPGKGIERSRTFFRLGWMLATCFILVTGILVTTTNRLRENLAAANERIVNLSRNMSAERGWAAALASPVVRISNFTLTPSADPALRGRATVDPSTRRALLVFENAISPSGHVYEAWALRDAAPVTLGFIHAGSSGRAVLRIQDVGDPATLTAFAVSLEPEGASAQEPTGPIVMIGSMAE